ncbi:hypothetical protein TURU_080647 [Turdus rufiventris]|nr:hypothetical protein TURU_080647 [Turdus rufiventris]
MVMEFLCSAQSFGEGAPPLLPISIMGKEQMLATGDAHRRQGPPSLFQRGVEKGDLEFEDFVAVNFHGIDAGRRTQGTALLDASSEAQPPPTSIPSFAQ